MFPGVGFNAGLCDEPNKPDVPVSASAGPTIVTTLNMTTPNGGTPTGTSVTSAAKYLKALNDGNSKYILLATDGEPSDSCDDITSSVKAIGDAAKGGVHVFVIGIGTTGINGLNDMADAGLEPNPNGGADHYYPAASEAALEKTIGDIAGGIASCSFPLSPAPAQPDLVSIEGNGATIPRDGTHMNGWDFGPGNMSINFYGSYCDQLKAGTINMVKAIFGCMIS
jgi:von Willebrand factor type A domain